MFRRARFPRFAAPACGILAASVFSVSAATFTWDLTGGGTWETNGNWDITGSPDDSVDIANLNNSITGDSTITVSSNISVDELQFNNSTHNYTVSGSGEIGFDDRLRVFNGDHFVAANLRLFADGILQTADGTSLTISGKINGSHSVEKTGAGTVILTGANTYSGDTTISNGTLVVTTSSLPGNVSSQGTLTFDQNSDGTYSGLISDTDTANGDIGTLIKTGSGTVTLTNTGNSFTGGTTINEGFIKTAGAGVFGGSGIGVTLNGGGIEASDTFNFGRDLTIGASGGTLNTSTFDLTLTSGQELLGSGALTKTGSGSLMVAGDNTSYSGDLTVSAGTVQLDTTTDAFSGDVAVASGAIFDLNDNNESILALTGAGNVDLGSGDLTVNLTTQEDFDGIISGTGGLIKLGSSRLELTGANTYSGGTTLTEGSLGVTVDSLPGNVSTASGTVFRITKGSGDPASMTQIVSGAGTFRKLGSGVIELDATQTYTGDTRLTNGTLRLGADNRIASSSLVTFDDNANTIALDLNDFDLTVAALDGGNATNKTVDLGSGTLTLGGPSGESFAGAITGTGDLVKNGSGTQILTGTNTYTGTTTINAGTLQLGADDVLSNSTDMTVGASGTFDLNDFSDRIGGLAGAGSVDLGSGSLTAGDAGDTTFSGMISGTGDLTKQGAGTLTLSSANTYLGGTTISAGTLQVGSGGTTGSISGDITNNATLAFNRSDDHTYSDVISGTGAVAQNGSGTLTLSATNTYSGGTSINVGTLAISADANLGDTSGGLSIDNGTLEIGGDFTLNHATTIANGATIDIGSSILQLDGRILGTGGLTLSGSGGTLTTSKDHDFTGGLTLSDVTFATGSFGNLGDTGEAITLDGGTIRQTNGSTRETSRGITLAAGGGTFDGDAGNTKLSGAVSGSGALTKTGSNSLVLSDVATTYTGATALNEGTLRTDIADALSSSSRLTLANTTGVLFDLNDTNQTINNLSGGGGNGGNITLGTATLTANNSSITTFAGDISGDGGLIKTGTNTLKLTGTNTYAGSTAIQQGILEISGSDALPDTSALSVDASSGWTQLKLLSATETVGDVTVSNGAWVTGGTLTGSSYTIVGEASIFSNLAGTGGLTKSGADTLSLYGTNTYTGTTTINAGTLLLGDDDVLSDSTAVTVGASGTFDLGNHSDTIASLAGSGAVDLGSGALTAGDANDTAFTGIISGTGSFTKQGSGTLTLSGANTYSGGTTISAGTLAGTTTSLQGNITNNAALTFDQSTDGTFSNIISGSGSVTKAGTGTVTFSGANTYSGGTSVNAGTLTLGHATDTLADSGAIAVAGGTLAIGSNSDTVGAVSLSSGSITGTGTLTGSSFSFTDTGTVSANLGGSGALTKSGDGTVTLFGANTYTGTTTINAGTLLLGANNVLSDFTAATIGASGTLDLDQYSDTIASLAGSGSVDLGTGSLTVGDGSDTTFSGVISNSNGSLVKQGAGTLTLSGTNTYSGGTTISTGTLAGTTTSLQGNITNNAALTFDQSTDGTFSNIISGSGSVTKAGTGTVTFSGANTYSGGTSINAGTLELGSTGALGSSGSISFGGGTLRHSASNTTDYSSRFDTAANQSYAVDTNSQDITWATALTSSGGSLTIAGDGTLTLSASNSFTGGIDLAGGTLRVSHSDALGSTGTISFSGGILRHTSSNTTDYSSRFSTADNQAYAIDTNGRYVNWASNLTSDGGTLDIYGSGSLDLRGNNSYTGATTIHAGDVYLHHDNALGSTAGGTTLANGATLNLEGVNIDNEDLELNGTMLIDDDSSNSWSGDISGTGGIELWQSTNGELELSGTNTFSGGVEIYNGATLTASGGSALPDDGVVRLEGYDDGNSIAAATLVIESSETIGSLDSNGSGGHRVEINTGSSGALTVTESGNHSFSGLISGSGGLTKEGAGVWTLREDNDDGNHTYSGTTNVNAGTLRAGEANILSPNSTHSIASGATLNLAGNDNTIKQLTGSGAVSLGSGTLTTGNNANHAFAGIISGSGNVVKQGTGRWTLSGQNTYTGATTINAGTIRLGADHVLSDSSALTVGASGTFDLDQYSDTIASLAGSGSVDLGTGALIVGDASDTTYSGIISGTDGSLTKQGTGTLTLSGTNTYTGGTTINDGTLTLGHATDTLADSSAVAIDGGTLDLGSNSDTVGAVSLSSGSIIGTGTLNGSSYAFTNSGSVSSNLGGSGTLTKSGAGTLTLTGANTFTGGTTINDGTLQLGANNVLSDSTAVTVGASGTFDLDQYSDTIASLVGSGSVDLGTGALTVGDASDTTFSGIISNSNGSLTKQGTGTLTLSGTNTFSGGTTINAGILSLGHATDTLADSGAVAVAVGTLDLGSNSDTVGAVSLSSGSITGTGTLTGSSYSFTNSGSVSANLGGSGALTKSGDGNVTLSGTNTYSGGTTLSGGSLVIGHNNALGTGTFDFAGGTLTGDGTARTLANTLTASADVKIGGSSALTFSGGFDLESAAPRTFNITNTADTTFSGVISNGSLTKQGSGTLTLSGTNTYSGGTTIANGTLKIGAAGVFNEHTSWLTIGASGTLDLGNHDTSIFSLAGSGSVNLGSGQLSIGDSISSSDGTFDGMISGTGSLVIRGFRLTLEGANTYTGGTTIENGEGRLRIGDGGSLMGEVIANGRLQFHRSDDHTFSNLISGTGLVEKSGPGTLTLTGANTFTNGVKIWAGTLAVATIDDVGVAGPLGVGNQVSLINGTLQYTGGTASTDRDYYLNNGSTGTWDVTEAGTTLTLTGGSSNTSGKLAKSGAGTLELAGTNSHTGSTTINAGTLRLGTDNALSNSTAVVVNASGTFDLNGFTDRIKKLTGDGAVTLGSGTLTTGNNSDHEFSGDISGTGSLTKLGNGNFTLSGTNTYSGDTNVNEGTLTIGAANALSPNTTLFVAPGATFDPGGFAQRVARLSGTGDINVGSGGLTVEPTSANTFTGTLSGSGGLTKNGVGELELTGTHTYSGQTQINAGRIRLTGSAAGSNFTVNNGGTLAGTGSLGNLTLAKGGRVAPGVSPGTLNAGDTIWDLDTSFHFEIDDATGTPGTGWDLLAIAGSLTIKATATNPFTLDVDTLLNGTDTAGAMDNFDADSNHSWTFVTTTTGISYDDGASIGASFALDTTGFANATNGTFSISQLGNNLALTYTTSAVPEPASFALILATLSIGFTLTRRRPRRF